MKKNGTRYDEEFKAELIRLGNMKDEYSKDCKGLWSKPSDLTSLDKDNLN